MSVRPQFQDYREEFCGSQRGDSSRSRIPYSWHLAIGMTFPTRAALPSVSQHELMFLWCKYLPEGFPSLETESLLVIEAEGDLCLDGR